MAFAVHVNPNVFWDALNISSGTATKAKICWRWSNKQIAITFTEHNHAPEKINYSIYYGHCLTFPQA